MKFYVDTSVWGGFDDKEFREWTIPFFELAKQGKFTIVLSDVTIGELEKAPELIRELPTKIPSEYLELVAITEEQLELADKYIQEGALSPKFHSDAQHIAISSILKVDSLVQLEFQAHG